MKLIIDITHPIQTASGWLDLHFSGEFEEGESCALFGSSGAGKTTILRIISGLLVPQRGYIQMGDSVWLDTKKQICLSAQKRSVGFVFQDYALFPNMTVLQNLLYALHDKRDKARIDELLALMGIEELASRYPAQLSGGQNQRVALARSLIRSPQILLLDEPLSALDLQTRLRLQDEIKNFQTLFRLTTFLVSHDMSEILKLANRVIGIKDGKCYKDTTPKEFFLHASISSKIRLNAEVLDIMRSDLMVILTLFVQESIIKVTMSAQEFDTQFSDLSVGSRVMVCDKAYNPLLLRASAPNQ